MTLRPIAPAARPARGPAPASALAPRGRRRGRLRARIAAACAAAAVVASLVSPLGAPSHAAASGHACAPLLDRAAVAAEAPGRIDVRAVQAGLRAVFGTEEPGLSDGILGPVTLEHLSRLCAAVPLPGGTEPVAGTLAVAREFAELDRALPAWRSWLDGGFLASGSDGRRLHAVGPPVLKRTLLQPGSGRCEDLAEFEVNGDVAALRMGLGAVLARTAAGGLPADATATELRDGLGLACAAYPPGTKAASLAEAMARLGRILNRVPGALDMLHAPAFGQWLEADPRARVLRLLATPDAVAALLREAQPELVTAPIEAPAACGAPEGQLAYYSLTGSDLEALRARTDLAEALAPVAERRFADRKGLVAAINEALGARAPDCAALIPDAIIARHEAASLVHALDAAAFERLALDPRLGPVLPAIAPLVGLESEDRPTLVARLEAAVLAVVAETVGAEISAAADAAAAAAEEVEPSFDVPTIPLPPDRAAERAPEFAITDPALLVLESNVADPELFAAISDTEYEQVAGRQVIRARVMSALRPIREARVAELGTVAMAAAEGAVQTRLRLIPAVVDELAAQPAFAAVSPGLLDRIGRLEGVAYPNGRLLDRALDGLGPAIDPVARQALAGVARKAVDEPLARRAIRPVAAADCGCVANRYEWDSLVYAFYPFWQFAPAGADAAGPPPVDFELVERIAFDGLTIGEDARLRYAPRWSEAAPTFVVSARRHQAKVDLAIRIRGWRDWTASQIEDAAFDVVEEVTMSRKADPLVTSGGLFGWLDRWFDRRPDGVTLIVEDYDGHPEAESARNLIAFVRAINAGLAGSGRTINLAFDIPLVGTAEREPLFQDLREIILPTDPLRPKMVEHVLVFLERPTALSKKVLRARVENAFSGEARIEVMRDILPVVPPGGNAPLTHEEPGEMLALARMGEPFGQFHHDVLYFQDNFRGIGFWPAPAAAATLPDGSPDQVAEIVRTEFDEWGLPRVLQPRAAEIDRVCTFVCPNRLAFYATGIGLAGLVLSVSGLSLYSRRLRAASQAVLMVPILTGALVVVLVLVTTCDRDAAIWAPLAMAALLAALAGLQTFQWYGRRLDGPMP